MKKTFSLFVALCLLFLTVTLSVAQTRVRYTPGDPTQDGKIEFTLIDPNDGDPHTYSLDVLKTWDAERKAQEIANILRANGWTVDRNVASMTFKRRDKHVTVFRIEKDNTVETGTFEALGFNGGIFNFGLANVNASGFDPNGNYSLLSVETRGGSYSTLIPPNYPASFLMNAVYSNLLSDGVNIIRTSPHSVRIIDTANNVFFGFLFYNLTDTGVDVEGAGGSNSLIRSHITIIIEGFYNSLSNRLNRADMITAYLRNINSPYNVVDSMTSILDSLTLNCYFEFPKARNGTYFIVVNHRNSLETWSASGVVLTTDSTKSFNFTTSASQAYGNNQAQVDTDPIKFAIYSGDIDQDGLIDLSDAAIVDNERFTTGYVRSDVNGDNFVDISDAAIVDNNQLVQKITPLGSEPHAPIDKNNIRKNQNEQRNNKDVNIKRED